MTTADDVFENTYGQVGDTTSVDALRTRLARAFEVAALRDPSAELAEFEAAVRHEHGERIANEIAANREAYLASSDLDPAWIAGWNAATAHHAQHTRDLSPAPTCSSCGHQHDPADPDQHVIPAPEQTP